MKRSELENKCKERREGVVDAIEQSPVKSVIAAFGVGIFFALFTRLVVFVLVLAAVVYAVVWYMSDSADDDKAKDEDESTNTDEPSVETSSGEDENPVSPLKVNGDATAASTAKAASDAKKKHKAEGKEAK